MKKIYCCIMLIVLLFCFIGCNEQTNEESNIQAGENTYVALLNDFSDSINSGEKQREYDFADTEKYKNVKIQEQKDVKVQNKNFIGNYKETKFKAQNFYPEFEYETSNGTEFSIDENGKLVFYFDFDREVNDTVLSQDECVQKAKEFLKDIVDITPYTVNVVDDAEDKYYKIYFAKNINGIKTTDHMRVRVSYDGTIYSYSAFMLDRVPVNTQTEDIDFEKIEQAVITKADSIYKDIKDNYDRIDYGQPEYILTILKDGKRAVICTIEVNAVVVQGIYEARTPEQLQMVIPVD